MDNDDAQCNEFLALNSIFTEECFQEQSQEEATEKKVLRNGALLLSVDQINPVLVSSNQSQDVQISVKHLPPIMLRFTLPTDYPSCSAPKFTILCPWLNKDQITALSSELDRLWTENVGSVILFTWSTFLQTSTLQILSLNSAPLVISPDILHHVLNYNDEQTDRMFSKAWITCLVCMREKSGNALMLFKTCEHAFCRECLASYFEMLIKDGNVRKLNCPYDKCETEASPAQVKELVSKKSFERYDQLLLKRAVNAMKDVTCCPRTNCGHPVVRDLGGVGTCQFCQFVFCLACRKEYHHMLPCSTSEEQKAMQSFLLNQAANDISWMSKPTSFTFDYSEPGSYLNVEQTARLKVKTKYGQGEWERLVDEGYSQTFMAKLECRPCPECDTPIQKNGGCDHMHCINCDCQFCWACLTTLTLTGSPHEHNKKNMEQIRQGVYGNWSLYD